MVFIISTKLSFSLGEKPVERWSDKEATAAAAAYTLASAYTTAPAYTLVSAYAGCYRVMRPHPFFYTDWSDTCWVNLTRTILDNLDKTILLSALQIHQKDYNRTTPKEALVAQKGKIRKKVILSVNWKVTIFQPYWTDNRYWIPINGFQLITPSNPPNHNSPPNRQILSKIAPSPQKS